MRKIESHLKLGQVITKEEIHSWNGNVIFNAGTSTGKTTFVLNNLSEYCLEHDNRILFVCNRDALSLEVQGLIHKSKITNVDVITYQKIENNIRNEVEFSLDYDYIALDECHHFLEVYNKYTDLSYHYLIQHPSKKIFMSATCQNLFNILINKEIVPKEQYYVIEKDYNYITDIIFYNRKTAYLDIIKDKIENTDEKIIYFTKSIDEAIDLYYTYKDIATFYCSKSTTNTTARRILKLNKGRIHDQTFEGRLLISTKALDVGVTLLDKSIKTIILNIFDHSSLQQCLGRKRVVDENDTCKVYIRNYYKGELNLFRSPYIKEMELFKNDRDEYDKTYGNKRERNNEYIYFHKESKDLKLNDLAYLSIKIDELELDEMIYGEWVNSNYEVVSGIGYKWFLLNKLGLSLDDERVNDYEKFEEEKHVQDLVSYLDSIVGKKLFKEEQEELKEVFKKDGLKSRTVGINTLNGNIKDRKLPYVILAKRTSERIDGKVSTYRYWEVAKDIEF